MKINGYKQFKHPNVDPTAAKGFSKKWNLPLSLGIHNERMNPFVITNQNMDQMDLESWGITESPNWGVERFSSGKYISLFKMDKGLEKYGVSSSQKSISFQGECIKYNDPIPPFIFLGGKSILEGGYHVMEFGITTKVMRSLNEQIGKIPTLNIHPDLLALLKKYGIEKIVRNIKSISTDYQGGSGLYPGIGIIYDFADCSHLSEEEVANLQLDLQFLVELPSLGLKDHIYDDLETVRDLSDAHRKARTKLITLFDDVRSDVKRGLYLSGLPGIGKTYLAIAAMRFFLAKGQIVNLVAGNIIDSEIVGFSDDEIRLKLPARRLETYTGIKRIIDGSTTNSKESNIWIIDDIIRGDFLAGKVLEAVVEKIAEVGGYLLVTSNSSLAKILDELLAGKKNEEKQRFKSRLDLFMKEARLEGEDQRKPEWQI